MTRMLRLAPIFLLLLLVPALTIAAPAKKVPLKPVATELDIDWEATSNLIFLRLPVWLEPGIYDTQVRVSEAGEPLFFERLSFKVPFADQLKSDDSMLIPSIHALQLLAFRPEESKWLLAHLGQGADIAIEIRLADIVTYAGGLTELVAASDKLREKIFHPLEATSKFADLRPRSAQKSLCVDVDDCRDDLLECEEDYCYWDYDEYMCEYGCENQESDCLATAVPECPAPTCTPGVINTSTSTYLIGSLFLGQACMKDRFFPGQNWFYNQFHLTYRTATSEVRRNADCSIDTVVTSVANHTSNCFRQTGQSCNFAFFYPTCLF